MNALKRLWRWLICEPTPVADTQPDVNSAYQLGHLNGYWTGVLAGRKALLDEIEADLELRKKPLTDLDVSDVTRMRSKLVH